MSATYDTYKGHKMIILRRDDNDKFPFQFGQAKAKLILAHIDEIRQFAMLREKSDE